MAARGRPKIWTKAEEAALAAAWADSSLTQRRIARRFRKSEAAIGSKVAELKLPPRRRRPGWSLDAWQTCHPLARQVASIARAKGFSLRELGDAADLSHAMFFQWRKGHTPQIESLESVIAVLEPGARLAIVMPDGTVLR